MSKSLSRKQLKHLAKLANLKLNPSEEEKLGVDISGILDYVSQIQDLNLKKIKPLTHVIDIKNVIRHDKIKNRKIITPKYFKIKKILWN